MTSGEDINGPGTTVTSKVLAILGAFAPGRSRLRLSDIARIAGVPVSTVHRLAAELVEWGALERREDGCYAIGMRLWEVGALVPRTLRDIARPYMQDLYEATRGNVHLSVLRDTEVLCVEKYFGRTSVRIPSEIGKRLPLHATSAGKVLLAFAPPELRYQVLSGGLQRFTPATIVRPGILDRVLSNVRRTDVAACVEELTAGASSVAAPIRDRDGTIIAALSVVVAWPRRRRDQLGPAVRTAAHGISRQL